MLAPSVTAMMPLLIRFAASLPLISFWVALGNAQSAGTLHSGLWSPRAVGHERHAREMRRRTR